MCHANIEESIKKNSILKNSNRRVSVPLKVNSVQSLSHIWLFVSHELQHARLPCPSPTPRAYSNSCPLSPWCHTAISSSVVPFSSCLQSFPASGSFPKSRLFASSGQSIGVSASASVLPMNIQDWFPLVSGRQQRDLAIHTYLSILPQTPLPSRLPHNTEQSYL